MELTDDRDDVFTKLDGRDGILLSMDKQSTYSTADVADTIIARALALQAADPNLHIVDLMNQGEYIDIVVDSVLNNLITGGALGVKPLVLLAAVALLAFSAMQVSRMGISFMRNLR